MNRNAATIKEYLADLPGDRRRALEAVRKVFLANLDKDYEEGIQYGMIGYFVPHRVYPDGYHCDPKQPLPFAGMASQKNHMSLYMMCIYGDPKMQSWFRKEWAKTGKKLDMGKACIRFKKLEDLPLELIGEAVARVPAREYIRFYEDNLKRDGNRAKTTAKKKTASTKKAVKKTKSTKMKTALRKR
jgi:hypothetical protein